METLGDILGFGASVASGGLFGLIGSGLGVVAKYFQTRADREWEEKKIELDMRLFDKQMESRKLETEMEIAVASSEGAWAGLRGSVSADKALAAHTGPLINGIKSLFRPFLTTALVGLSFAVIFMMSHSITGATDNLLTLFNEAEIKDLLRYMIYSLFFATTTAITWWFGDRAFAPPGMKNR